MLSNIHCRLNHQFRDNQKASMSLILGALGKLYNFGTKFALFSVINFWFFAWIIFVWKNEEFWKIYFLTKFVPESIKNELTYKFYTILEWDKCQQFADFIKFLVFWFALSQMWKTFVPFFMHHTLVPILQTVWNHCTQGGIHNLRLQY